MQASTIVFVPDGSDAPLTLRVSLRAAQVFGAIGLGAALLVVTALLTIGLDLTGHSPFADVGARRQARMLATLQAQVVILRDTVASMAGREKEIRTLAGLETADSLRRTDSAAVRSPAPSGDIGTLIERATVLASRFDEASAALRRDVDRADRTPSIMPTTGWLSSQFSLSRFHPILHINRPHEGIDIAAPYGMPVVAPAAGTVLRITRQFGYGLVLEIDHGNSIVTKYAHLSRTLVRPGQRVIRGDPIAAVGNSGLATGPHLHYEVHVNGRVVNPLTFVLPESIPN